MVLDSTNSSHLFKIVQFLFLSSSKYAANSWSVQRVLGTTFVVLRKWDIRNEKVTTKLQSENVVFSVRSQRLCTEQVHILKTWFIWEICWILWWVPSVWCCIQSLSADQSIRRSACLTGVHVALWPGVGTGRTGITCGALGNLFLFRFHHVAVSSQLCKRAQWDLSTPVKKCPQKRNRCLT